MAVPVDSSAIVCPWCRIPCSTTAADIVLKDVEENKKKQKAKAALDIAGARSCTADILDESTPACSAVVGSWDMSSIIGGMATSNGIKSNVVSPKKKANPRLASAK